MSLASRRTALCFREKYLKFENPEAFNKHKIVDGNKTNIFALSLLDPVINVEELVNCFREITDFFRSEWKIKFNPLKEISFDGVRSTATTIGGLKVFSDDSYLILVEYLEEVKEFHLYQNKERSHGISTVLMTNSIDLVYFALRVFHHDYFGVQNVFYLDKITD